MTLLGSRLLGVYRLNSLCEQQLVHHGAVVWIVQRFIDLIQQMLSVTPERELCSNLGLVFLPSNLK
jgi:hypothetical protein